MSRHDTWHLALEHQLEAHKWHQELPVYLDIFFKSIFTRQVPDGTVVDIPDSQLRLYPRLVIETLWRADTIYITRDMEHLLLQAAHDLPEEATFDAHSLLTPMGFLYFEEPIEGKDVHGQTMTINAFAWKLDHAIDFERDSQEIEVIHTFFFSSDPTKSEANEKMAALGYHIPFLSLAHYYPIICGDKMIVSDALGSELVVGITKIFWAFQLLANQKIVSNTRMIPPRSTRRRYQAPKDGWRYISLITLRRQSMPKKEEAESIEWTHRWVVTGHWRKQWYPKLKIHQWKYIHEYIKGPEDKPLWVRERRVFNFRR